MEMSKMSNFKSSMQVITKVTNSFYRVGGELKTWGELLPEQQRAYLESQENSSINTSQENLKNVSLEAKGEQFR